MNTLHKKTPFFSVVMPAYNAAEFIGEAIASVQGQTYLDWELVIVNDGSSDDTPSVIEDRARVDPRVSVIHQPNRGAAAARNAGIVESRSPWICYLDSDDIWFPETLSKYHDYITAHPRARFIYGYRHRLRNGKITVLKGSHQDRSTTSRDLFLFPYLSPMRVCHQRSLVDEVGGYDENLPGACEDIDLYLRMGLKACFEPIDFATGLRRRHTKNISKPTGENYAIEAAMLKRFLSDYGGATILSREEIDRRLGRLYYVAGREYYAGRRFRQSISALDMANRYRPTLKTALRKWWARLMIPFSVEDKAFIPMEVPEPRWTIGGDFPAPAGDAVSE